MAVRTILRKQAVLAATGWSNSTLYKKIQEGKFPKPIKLDPDDKSDRAVGVVGRRGGGTSTAPGRPQFNGGVSGAEKRRIPKLCTRNIPLPPSNRK
jgi:Prophage CP4-57 regulatory protein (AlpA)